ncbi:MAG: hypothetical protein DRG78_22290 [Epsilonproteobacteria bacterium]|nr:MAG: hypothetical protein DRG78_22290 [Campylobacterota bacterium]
MNNKVNEKTLRLKYVRVLEKFAQRSIALLKHPQFDFNLFIIQTKKNYILVEQAQSIRLDSEYLKKLIVYINTIMNTVEYHSETFEEEQQLLLKESNLLHKEKNKNSYKKDKHTKKKFYDGY